MNLEDYAEFNVTRYAGDVYKSHVTVAMPDGYHFRDSVMFLYHAGDAPPPGLPNSVRRALLSLAELHLEKRYPNGFFEKDTPELLAYDLVDQED